MTSSIIVNHIIKNLLKFAFAVWLIGIFTLILAYKIHESSVKRSTTNLIGLWTSAEDWKPISQFPTVVIDAFLTAEDSSFRKNKPCVPAYTYVLDVIRGRKLEPTLNTLVARMTLTEMGHQKAMRRIIDELIVSELLDCSFSKDQVIEIVLNKVYMGTFDGILVYGFSKAANRYFSKDIAALSLSQVAQLSGIPNQPHRFNPIKNPGNSVQRRNYILARMAEDNLISQAEAAEASKAPSGQ
jgi:penicillin-binding protein 1A